MTKDEQRLGSIRSVPQLRSVKPVRSGLPAAWRETINWLPVDTLLPPAALDMLSQAAQHLKAPCYLHDLQDGRLIWVNPQFAQMFEVCRGSAEPLPRLADLMPDDDPAGAAHSAALAAARDGEILTSERDIRVKDGATCRFRIQETVLARGLDRTPRLVLGLAQQAGEGTRRISKRNDERRLERVAQMAVANAGLYAAEQEQRLLFETALAHIPLATAILDGNTLQIRWANHAFEDFVDDAYRGQPLVGAPLARAIGRIAAGGLAEIVGKVTATARASTDLRYIYRGPQIGARYWRFSLQPLPGETGELMLHIEDVTGSIAGQRPARPAGTTIPGRAGADEAVRKF